MVQFREHPVPLGVQREEAQVVQRLDQAALVSEVVLHGRVVLLTGLLADLPEGDVFDAAFGEEPFGGEQDLPAGLITHSRNYAGPAGCESPELRVDEPATAF
ncbi:hypothetical protein Mth01_03070 [Sphaerimonospora thailandensis]|uniref:Uncharacterized protein n=1 Tax=Sphaerimonospora thailandensis TaxID=795644 RepID=A0A8J3R4Y9_9ACTN|nr:hypothetical protein Mth01_03070 [Sphaerimonospora thailandensis]